MEIVIPLVVLLFSAILHEVMHGVIAYRLGDPTAKLMGRLTLNPIPHIDPIMSVLLPALLIFSGSPVVFGAAKPVPVNPIHFKDPKKDMALVGLAGPLTNLLIAAIASQFLKVLPPQEIVFYVLYTIVIYNLMLGIINLIPIPPLDGSKVLASILPSNLARSYLAIEQFGIFILFALLLFPIGGFSLGSVIESLIKAAGNLLGVPYL